MGVPNEDVVLIESGKKEGDPCVITVNCPDKTGLGCDLCRIILEFGLCITKGGSDLRFLFLDSLSHPRDFTVQGHFVIPRKEKGLIDFSPFLLSGSVVWFCGFSWNSVSSSRLDVKWKRNKPFIVLNLYG